MTVEEKANHSTSMMVFYINVGSSGKALAWVSWSRKLHCKKMNGTMFSVLPTLSPVTASSPQGREGGRHAPDVRAAESGF